MKTIFDGLFTPEHVDKLSRLVRIKIQHSFPDSYQPRNTCGIQVPFSSNLQSISSSTTISLEVESVKSSVYSPV